MGSFIVKVLIVAVIGSGAVIGTYYVTSPYQNCLRDMPNGDSDLCPIYLLDGKIGW